MQLDFWFDPTCPFCWLTSRWLEDVRTRRSDVEVAWHPFSLMVKNADVDVPQQFRAPMEASFLSLRVIAALEAEGRHDDISAVYRDLGRQIHHEDAGADFDLPAALKAAGAEEDLLAAADDESFDAAIQASMDEALALAGDDTGVPIMAFPTTTADGPGRSGFFGPVLTVQPDPDAADALFDHLVGLASLPGFAELKRARHSGPALPDRV